MDVVHSVHVLETQAQVDEEFPHGALRKVLAATIELLILLKVLDDVRVQVANLAELDDDVDQRLVVISSNKRIQISNNILRPHDLQCLNFIECFELRLLIQICNIDCFDHVEFAFDEDSVFVQEWALASIVLLVFRLLCFFDVCGLLV